MHVIVAGGGVAGAASAIALRRIGAQVTVYEAYADPAGSVGSFLSLARNGLGALETLGCLDAVRRAGFEVDRQLMWSASGRLLGDMPRGRPSGDPVRSITLMRGRLVEELRAAAQRAGARIITGERLTDAETVPGGVRAAFAGGRTAEADLLVGADGIWSATRRILDPGAPEPAYAGFYSASGVSAGVPGIAPGTFNMTFGRNGVFVHIAVPDGTVWWTAQVSVPTPPDLDQIDLEAVARLYREEEMPAAVLRATTDWHRPTLNHTMPVIPVWRDDRTVLVGDAKHPVGSGQGASMALEDAVVLATALHTAGSVPQALADYEARRRARMARMAKAAGLNREAKTAGPIGRHVRSLVLPLLFRYGYERATAWLYTEAPGPLPV
ncbi:FAD-dependent oxidoreductase [Actinomadura sp. NBRC 104425]|uniref:FAD-dependent oxidoreductase n=1 Tax=Actinomadura sp. NBRC 104425 TaxID=3032204 RepID=UPI00249FC5D2|nr:FAD-dependent monooxygenase [Actinomadura sp. NBRC 104425]GLZ10819.1 FAD-dependent oxidoreductase [Actinomadura sp. NBRC 104425]